MDANQKQRPSLDRRPPSEEKKTGKLHRHASKGQNKYTLAKKESRETDLHRHESRKSREQPEEPLRPNERLNELLYEEAVEEINEHRRHLGQLLEKIRLSRFKVSEILEEQGDGRLGGQKQMEVDKEEIRISINKFDHMMKEKSAKSPAKREQAPVWKRPIVKHKGGKKGQKVLRKLTCDICSEELEEYRMVRLFLCHHLFC